MNLRRLSKPSLIISEPPLRRIFRSLTVMAGILGSTTLGLVTIADAQTTYYQDSEASDGFGPNPDFFLWNTTIAWSWNTNPSGNGATVPWVNATTPNNAVLGNGSGTGSYFGNLGENISVGTITAITGTWGLALNSYTLTLNSAANWNLSLALSGAGSIIKAGSGTMTVSSVNNYSGGTTINGGTLVFTSTNTNVGPVTVNPSGKLQLGTTLAVPNSTALTLAGGTLELGGAFSQSFAPPLALTASSTINFGTGIGTKSIGFGDTSAQTWNGTLTIQNYNSATDALRFGTISSALSGAQLSSISFDGSPAQIDANGFVTPVPEQATYAVLLASGALAFAVFQRRKAQKACPNRASAG